MMRCTTFLERPARGGSTTSTSGRPARSSSSGSARRVSPAKKWAFVIPLRARARDRVGDGRLDELDAPQLAGARGERQRDRADPRSRGRTRAPSPRARRTRRRPRTAPRPSRCWSGRTPRRRSAGRARRGARAARASPHTSSVSPPGGRLGERSRARPEHAAEALAEPVASARRERAGLELAVGRDEADLQPAGAPPFAHDEVAQPRAPVGAPGAGARGALAARGPRRAAALPRPTRSRPCCAAPAQRRSRGRGCRARRRAGSPRSPSRGCRRPARGSRTRARPAVASPSPNEYSSLLR